MLKISRVASASCWPSGVRWIYLPTCSIGGEPIISASFFICMETVGWLRGGAADASGIAHRAVF
jgi:hypothetical protein